MSQAVIDINSHLTNEKVEPEKQNQFVLRVLNGKQQGAEIALRSARYRLGSDADCDIVLIGEHIAPQHLELFFADGRTTLTQLHETIYINNQPIRQNALPLEIESKQILMLGETAISIGTAQDDWPQLDVVNTEIIETLAVMKASTPQSFMLLAQHQLQDKQNLAKIIMAASFCMSLLIVLVAFSLHGTRTPQSIAAAAAERLSAQIASDPAYQHVNLIDSEPKKQLIGYVRRSAALNRLRNLASPSFVDINVVSVEKIEKSLNILSEVYGSNLAYRLIPDKNRDIHLLLYGTIEATQQREAMQALLRRDLPAITSIKIDVITQSEALEIINSWLNNYPNFAGLRTQKTKDGIFIKGNLLGNFKDLWQKVLIKSPPRLPQNMLPFIDIYFSPPFEGKIVSFITGKKAQLRIFYKDKSVLSSLGDGVRGGFSIKQIMRDKIILSWQKRNFIYPLPR